MKKRVCAYARVSTNSRGQEHSFEFQSSYWNEKLGNDPELEYVGLYADQGISGKDANRRPQFMQMVNAVREGKIDMIFTKSVQRFGRNTEELLSFVREFRDLGVPVYFEKENINTMTNGNDLYLTIAVAVAEDDLSRYSQNVKWSVKDKFKKGEPVVNGRLYGFKMGRGTDDKFEIVEEEAKVVRRIFQMYLDGISGPKICKILNEEGVPSANNTIWYQNSIMSILDNEKYVGDLLLQKYYHENGIKYINHGERDQYYVTNHHHGIIPRDLWDAVQVERRKRTNPALKGIKQKDYIFRGLIYCGECGKRYIHKVSHSYYTPTFDVWYCPSLKQDCHSIRVKDTELKELFVEAYNEFITQKYKGEEEADLINKTNALIKEQQELVRLKSNGWISNQNYKEEYERLNVQIKELNERVNKISLRNLSEKDFKNITVFNESKVEKFLLKIVIIGDEADFYFYNGVVVTKKITGTRIYEKDRKLMMTRNGGNQNV